MQPSSTDVPPAKRSKTSDDSVWSRAAVFAQGSVSIELFTPDGTALEERRSFLVSTIRDGHKYSLRLRFRELLWLSRLLDLDFGNHSVTVARGRLVTLRLADTLVTVGTTIGRVKSKVYFDRLQAQVLLSIVNNTIDVFGYDWDMVSVDDLLQAFGQLRRRNAVNPVSLGLLTCALGSRVIGKPVDSIVGYGERLGNPPAYLVQVSDKLKQLLDSLVSDNAGTSD